MLYRLIVGLKNARGLRIPACIHIKLALGGQDISLAPTSGNFYTLLSSTPRPMVYFDDDSEQYTSWKKVGNVATYLAVSKRLRMRGRTLASRYSVEGRLYDRGISLCCSV